MKQRLLLIALLITSTIFSYGKAPVKDKTINPRVENNIQQLLGLDFSPVINKSSSIEGTTKQQQLDYSQDYAWLETDWFPSAKTMHSYNASGQLIETIGQYMSDTNYVDNYKSSFTYKDNGDLHTETYSYYSTSDWVSEEQSIYSFDDDGNMTTVIYYNYIDYEWDASYKVSYTYNNNNQPIEGIAYDLEGGGEQAGERVVFLYNDNTLATTLYYEMETDWMLGDSGSHISIDGYITEEMWYSKDGSEFTLDDRSLFAYDNNGNPIKEEYSYFDSETTNDWVIYSRYEYTYDLNYTYEELVTIPKVEYELDHSNYIVNKPETVQSFYQEESDSSLQPSYKTIFNYSDISTALRENSSSVVSVYPNPTSDFIRFKAADSNANFQLIDLQGRTVLEQDINTSTEISVSSLAKGLYIYIISVGNHSKRGELIIK